MRLAYDLAVPVGTGVATGTKHSQPASRARRGTTGNPVDEDHTAYPSLQNPHRPTRAQQVTGLSRHVGGLIPQAQDEREMILA